MYVVTFWVTFHILKQWLTHLLTHISPLGQPVWNCPITRAGLSLCDPLWWWSSWQQLCFRVNWTNVSDVPGSPVLYPCMLTFFHIGGCPSALGVILFDYLQIWQFSWVVIVLKGHWAEAVHFYCCWKNIIFYELPRYSPNYVYCTLLSTVAVNSSFVFSYLRGLNLSSQTCI